MKKGVLFDCEQMLQVEFNNPNYGFMMEPTAKSLALPLAINRSDEKYIGNDNLFYLLDKLEWMGEYIAASSRQKRVHFEIHHDLTVSEVVKRKSILEDLMTLIERNLKLEHDFLKELEKEVDVSQE